MGRSPASPEEQLSKFKSPQTMSNATSSSGLAVLDEEVDFRKSASHSRSISSCSHRMALSSTEQNHRDPMTKLQPGPSQALGKDPPPPDKCGPPDPTFRGVQVCTGDVPDNSLVLRCASHLHLWSRR